MIDTRLDQLAYGWLDQSLDAEQQTEFESRLLASDAAQEHYLSLAAFHGYALEAVRLKWGDFASDLSAPQTQLMPPVEDDQPPRSPVLGFLGKACQSMGVWLTSPRALLIGIGGALATYFIGLMISVAISRAYWSVRGTSAAPGPSANAPARIVAQVSLRWQDREPASGAEETLPPGMARLAEGVIQLKFQRGACVTIQGPAEFAALGPQSIQLVRGRLAAEVPAQARGFAVETPAAQVVDLGTEFDVAVDERGCTDVQVHQGKIEIRLAGVAAPTGKQTVIAGQAMRVSVGDSAPTPIEFDRTGIERIHAAIAAATEPQDATVDFAKGAPIWLGNLFDDPPGTRLADAVRSDTFKAVPKPHKSLGVERTFHAGHSLDSEDGWQYVSVGKVQIAPNVTLDLSNLGWIGAQTGAIANDAFTRWAEPPDGPPYSSGGISTRGTLPVAPDSPKIEEGIGMMPDALLTFDLDEIRAAGDLAGRKLVFYCPRAGIADNSAMGLPHAASVYFAVFVTGGSGEILAAVVNGKPVRMVQQDDVWSVAQVSGKPQGGYDDPILFVVPIAPEARYLSLVTTLADKQSGGDFSVWSGACLKVVR